MPKKVVRCGECVNRVYDMGIGFVPNVTMMCSVLEQEVDEDDGCTFGMIGDGGIVSKQYDIDLSNHAAINGYYNYG